MLLAVLLVVGAALWGLRLLRRALRRARRGETSQEAPQPFDRSSLRRLAAERGLERVAERVAALAVAGSQLRPLAADEPAGFSKLGGLPELPEDRDWPLGRGGEPLAFLAQLDLDEASGPRLGLPRGRLYLFWDEDPDLYRSEHLAFLEGATLAFSEREPPRPLKGFPEQRVAFSPLLTLPGYSDLAVDSLELDAAEQEAYFTLEESLRPTPDHHLAGAGHWIQDDGREEAEMRRLGLRPEDWRAHMAEVARGAAEWTLVLELSAQGPFAKAPAWGDSGSVYLLSRREELAQGQLESALLMQCH